MKNNIKNYIGQNINGFKVLDAKRENNRTYLKIICPKCGSEKWMRQERVKIAVSCGCECDKNKFKSHDLTGQKIGRLTVVSKTTQRDSRGSVIWECYCDCGGSAQVSAGDLILWRVKSCGCLGRENSQKNGKIAGECIKNNYCVSGTNVNNLTMRTPKSNKSGVKGVSWDNSRGKWVAQIRFQGKNYNLGRYSDLDEAAKIRKEAENYLFSGFLEWYAENYPEQWKRMQKKKKSPGK